MREYFFLFLLLFFPYLLSANPVTNVRAIQEGKKIVVLYDLSEDTYVSQIIIEVDGKSRVIPNEFLKGDVNKDLKAGADKRVEYDVLADYVDGFKSDNVVFVIEQGGIYAVDLGLSVKWATCNVGATKPEEYGDYFAWGEVKPKKQYDWNTYKYCKGTNTTITKYCNISILGNDGFTDDKTILDLEDDAAVVNWGGSWRMSTDEETIELRTKCAWTLTTQNGVKGYKVIGPNGNSIFLPAAGYMNGDTLNNAGSLGYYWSSSLDSGIPIFAYGVSFYSGGVNWYYSSRRDGRSVRPVCPKKQEHEWVDLGLSVKWASCNVGATKPEEYGDYFAWGETKPKTQYDWSTYKYCRGTRKTMTKYCTQSGYGIVDNNTMLDPEDDAATVNWGVSWRMPTYAEFTELQKKCKWKWTKQNRVKGYKVIGPNGNSIFLPAAGYMNEGALYGAGSSGLYWSSWLSTGISGDAYRVYFHSGNVDWSGRSRFYGVTVRPVSK